MFYSDESVNDLLQYSKSMVDDIASKKTKQNDFLVEQYLIFAGMVAYYGFEHINAIYKAFQNTAFIDNLGDVSSFVDNLDMNHRYPAFCQSDIRNIGGRYFIDKSIHYFSRQNAYDSYQMFMEELLHEVNHCVNSSINPICKRDTKMLYRIGLYLSSVTNSRDIEGLALEEGINTLQTAEIMKLIVGFSQYNIDNPTIRCALDRLKHVKVNDFGRGYEDITLILRPLYWDKSFYHLVREGRITGGIKEVREDFDSHVGTGAYFEFADAVDHSMIGDNYRRGAREKVLTLSAQYINNK